MNPLLQLRKIRDFGDRISDTIRFIKLNWLNLLILYGIFVLPFLLVGIYLGAASFMDIWSKIGTPGASQLTAMGWKVGAAIVCFFLASASLATAMYRYMDLWDKKGEKPLISDVASGFLSYLGSTIIYSFLGILLLTLVLSPLFFLVYLSKNNPVGIMFLMLLMMCFIFFCLVYFFLIYPANTIGKNEMGNPLRAAWILLKGSWWSSFGYMFVLFMIYYVFSLVTNLAITMFFGVSTLVSPENGTPTGKGMVMLYGISLLIQQVFYIIVFAGVGILYYSLHEEKMGSGLASRIGQIGRKDIQPGQQEEY